MRALKLLPVLALLIGCGGSTEIGEPAPGSETGTEPTGETPTTSTPRKPEAVGTLPEAANMAPFHLYVSNQSFDIDTVDIDVYVDGVKLVTGDFEVKNQHNWVTFEFKAEAGKSHTVRAVSKKGGVEHAKEVEVPAAGRWVIVEFWYYGPDHYDPTPEKFTIEAYDEEPRFA